MSGSKKKDGGRLIAIEVAIATKYSDEEQCFYALSPQLRCVRDGETAEQALAMCREALEVLFESLIERGTLRQYLLDNGYEEFQTQLQGQPGILFTLKEGNLIPQSRALGAEAITSAPFTGMYKERFHPRQACVRA